MYCVFVPHLFHLLLFLRTVPPPSSLAAKPAAFVPHLRPTPPPLVPAAPCAPFALHYRIPVQFQMVSCLNSSVYIFPSKGFGPFRLLRRSDVGGKAHRGACVPRLRPRPLHSCLALPSTSSKSEIVSCLTPSTCFCSFGPFRLLGTAIFRPFGSSGPSSTQSNLFLCVSACQSLCF